MFICFFLASYHLCFFKLYKTHDINVSRYSHSDISTIFSKKNITTLFQEYRYFGWQTLVFGKEKYRYIKSNRYIYIVISRADCSSLDLSTDLG
jgi:hypothetical protein